MFNWKYPAVAIVAAAAITPMICSMSQVPFIGRAHANQQSLESTNSSSTDTDGQAKPKERKRMSRRNALRELHARRSSARIGEQ